MFIENGILITTCDDCGETISETYVGEDFVLTSEMEDGEHFCETCAAARVEDFQSYVDNMGFSWEEDGIATGTENESVFYAVDHCQPNTWYRTTLGNMIDGIVKDEEVMLTSRQALAELEELYQSRQSN